MIATNSLNNYTLHNSNNTAFRAKMPLNDCRQFVNSQIQGTSSLDIIFKESPFIKYLNKLYVFLTKNIINNTKNNDNNLIKVLNKNTYKLTQQIRLLSIRAFTRKNRSEINQLSNAIPPESNEYIEELAKIGNSINDKFIRINSEDRPFDSITDSKDSTIFVLNHPDYNKDKICYTIISSLLSKLYVSKNRQADCPRPKLLASRNLTKILGETLSKTCENFWGTVYINADTSVKNSITNISPMLNLVKDFIDNKINIFIFPEGNNSLVKDKPLEQRMQPGVAGIIRTVLNKKNSVRIVPIGLSYTAEKNSFGNIFIGKPMIFKKSDKEFIYTGGIENEFLRTNRKKLSQTILNEICKNLKYCTKKADELK